MKDEIILGILFVITILLVIFAWFLPTLFPAPKLPDKVDMLEKDYISLKYGSNPGAPVTIVEFVDYECQICKEVQPLLDIIIAEYGNHINLVIKQFPLEIHKNSMDASLAALCVQEQVSPKGLDIFVHLLFKHQDKLDQKSLLKTATELPEDVDRLKLQECIRSPNTHARILKDQNEGLAHGVRGTPTIFVNGKKYEGVPEQTEFKNTIQAILDSRTVS